MGEMMSGKETLNKLVIHNDEVRFRYNNVALLPQDHDLLKKIAKDEQRTMTRQLSVIIRQFARDLEGKSAFN